MLVTAMATLINKQISPTSKFCHQHNDVINITVTTVNRVQIFITSMALVRLYPKSYFESQNTLIGFGPIRWYNPILDHDL